MNGGDRRGNIRLEKRIGILIKFELTVKDSCALWRSSLDRLKIPSIHQLSSRKITCLVERKRKGIVETELYSDVALAGITAQKFLKY